MKKQIVLGGIVTLLICAGLCGCNQDNNSIDHEKSRFIGTWHTSDGLPSEIEFSNNGTLFYGAAGTWDLRDGKLVIKIPSYNLNDTYTYEFSNNDRTLMTTLLSNNFSLVYTKQ